MNSASIQTRRIWLQRLSLLCCAAAVFSLVSGAVAATVDEVEKEIIQAQGKLKSYSAFTETRQDLEIGRGIRMKGESKGPMEWKQQGSKYLYRIEMKGTSVTTTGGEEKKSKANTLIVCDGDFMYTLIDTDGQKMAIKSRVDPTQAGDAKGLFTMWRKGFILMVLPDEKVDGKECYVLELTPREKKEGEPSFRQKCWFRKDVGLPVKMVSFGKDDKPMMTTTMTDIKTDVEFKPERFKFELPDGVQLMDMTKVQAASTPASGPEAAKTEPPKETPKTETQAEEKPQQAEEQKQSPEKEKDSKDKAVKGVLNKLFK